MPYIDGLPVANSVSLDDLIVIDQGGNGTPGSAITRSARVSQLPTTAAAAVKSVVGATGDVTLGDLVEGGVATSASVTAEATRAEGAESTLQAHINALVTGVSSVTGSAGAVTLANLVAGGVATSASVTAEATRAEAAEALLAPKANPVLTTTNSEATFSTGQSNGVPFSLLPGVADVVINQTNAGGHPTNSGSALVINSAVVGSGANGPTTTDAGITISVVKDNLLTSPTVGEIDGLLIFTRNGQGDTSGVSANVATTAGFSVILEGVSNQLNPTTGDIITGCDCQIGGINTGFFIPPATNIGYLFAAKVGTWVGLQLQAEGSSVIGIFITCQKNDGTTAFQVVADGSVSSAGTYNGTGYQVSGEQVVTHRQHGWTAGTGVTPNIGAIDYGTATLAQLAARVMAVEEALFAGTGHGLIGT